MKKNNPFQWFSGARPLLALLAFYVGVTVATIPNPALAAEFVVYKSPTCGCCKGWVEHLRMNGHTVITKDMDDLDVIKKIAGVPERLQACHTAMVDGYIVEGHVPVADIQRLLTERPKAVGLAVPGMPAGAPGMGGNPDRYNVMLFRADGSANIYARY